MRKKEARTRKKTGQSHVHKRGVRKDGTVHGVSLRRRVPTKTRINGPGKGNKSQTNRASFKEKRNNRPCEHKITGYAKERTQKNLANPIHTRFKSSEKKTIRIENGKSGNFKLRKKTIGWTKLVAPRSGKMERR